MGEWTGPAPGDTLCPGHRPANLARQILDHAIPPRSEAPAPRPDRGVRAFIENLTGPSRGEVHWLSADRIDATVDANRFLLLSEPTADAASPDAVARLSQDEHGYHLQALNDADIWVNGRHVASAHLLHGDMIEFGENGPMSRFRLCDRSFPRRWAVDDIVSDAVAYARSSRRPFGRRMSHALMDGARRVIWQTTVFFRIMVVLSLVVLAGLGYLLYANDRRFEAAMQAEARRIEAISAILAQTRQDALAPEDLAALREELDARLLSNSGRLDLLERQSGASARIIMASLPSVAFLQGAYGVRHIESGALLRHVLGPDGRPQMTPFGQPRIAPDGTGAPLEFQFSGTGFLLGNGQQLVTNRHVALPWTSGDRNQALAAGGLEPVMLKLLAYFPGQADPLTATLDTASDTADLAILTLDRTPDGAAGLTLAQDLPSAGDEIVLMGYPTGLRAMLAQAGPDFLARLEAEGQSDFWSVAARLAAEGLIQPLASRGIVAKLAPGAVVYDAETTTGGSGGPVLDSAGQVIAVNAAILPEFGGSNIGVPVTLLHDLQAGGGH